jgi:hypothetical protein
LPASINTSFDLVFTTSGVNGIGNLSVGRKALASACCTSARLALRTNPSVIGR